MAVLEKNQLLSDIFDINVSYCRSINLKRDIEDSESFLNNYILTNTAKSIIKRISQTINSPNYPKSFCLTGPYGTGKSSFALFLANIFLNFDFSRLEDKEKAVFSANGYYPIIVSGAREPIQHALLSSLLQASKSFLSEKKGIDITNNIEKTLELYNNKGMISNKVIIKHYFEFADLVKKKAPQYKGIFLIIDELGKFLEYSVLYPRNSDIFVLQELAEYTKEDNFLFLTILHQNFENYLNGVSKEKAIEWQKIQERFENIAFQESPEELLKLVSKSIEKKSTYEINKIDLPPHLKPNNSDTDSYNELLNNCLPLHPVTSMLLAPLFKNKLSQNERSLFSFISSREPYSLLEYLKTTTLNGKKTPSLYCPSDLFDYVSTSLGSALYYSGNSKKWSVIESSISRAVNFANELEINIIKTVGLLTLVSDTGNLKSSLALLDYLFVNTLNYSKDEFDKAIENLINHKVLIFRSFNNSYSLWEGSDVDIEERTSIARTSIDKRFSLMSFLMKNSSKNYVLAKKHFLETGTLRYYEIFYADETSLDSLKSNFNKSEADGFIIKYLSEEDVDLKAFVKNTNTKKPVILIRPCSLENLRHSAEEILVYNWVLNNTPELESDAIAKKEFIFRLSKAQSDLQENIEKIFGFKSGYESTVFYSKEKHTFTSTLEFSRFLSTVFDNTYNKCPKIINEHINRNKISTAAASARNYLIKALITNSDKKELGITGYPPEKSIYMSLLKETKIHQKVNDTYKIVKSNEANFGPLWETIENIIENTDNKKIKVSDIYKILKDVPFGVKEGLLPILLCIFLSHYESEIALYEEGTFIPEITMPAWERLIKKPERFEIKYCKINDNQKQVLDEFLEIFNIDNKTISNSKQKLLLVTKNLCAFIAGLTPYSKQTKRLKPESYNLREVLINAKEPDSLLFRDIQEAIGCEPFQGNINKQTIKDFFIKLKPVMEDIGTSYERLLENINISFQEAFQVNGDIKEIQKNLTGRADKLIEINVKKSIQGTLLQLADDSKAYEEWVIAIASSLMNKTTKSWNDNDLNTFKVKIQDFANEFRRAELLKNEIKKEEKVIEEQKLIIRIGMIDPSKNEEQERIVYLKESDIKKVEKMEKDLKNILKKETNKDLRLAVLSKLAYEQK
ncbi:MAG: hypothetical protein AB1782_03430 [Cyanobacteriota bacterium]